MPKFFTVCHCVQAFNDTPKNINVTGGYSGIGLETTKNLSEAGATIIVGAIE